MMELQRGTMPNARSGWGNSTRQGRTIVRQRGSFFGETDGRPERSRDEKYDDLWPRSASRTDALRRDVDRAPHCSGNRKPTSLGSLRTLQAKSPADATASWARQRAIGIGAALRSENHIS